MGVDSHGIWELTADKKLLECIINDRLVAKKNNVKRANINKTPESLKLFDSLKMFYNDYKILSDCKSVCSIKCELLISRGFN